jgi:type IV secretion system protein VirB5
MRPCSTALLAILVMGGASSPAHAQWAVVDAQAIAQLVREIQTMEQQLGVAQNQLTQARQALDSMTGPRGMQSLLSGIERNYLPASAAQLLAPAPGGRYPTFATDVSGALLANAVLTTGQLTLLSPGDRTALLASRQAAAVRQAVAQESLSDASGRFAQVQSLIAAISKADDQKAILELQARMVGELAMLQGEQNKLATLAQTLKAEDSVNALKEREAALAAQGEFATRLRPAP